MTGQLLYDMLVQIPTVAILVIVIIIQRRDFNRAMTELTTEYKKLEDVVIRMAERDK